MLRPSQLKQVGSSQFWILAAFIAFSFFVGGGSRADNTALIVLRPVAILVCGYALWSLRTEDLRRFRALIGLAAATFLIVALQLIPLPPAIWTHLPGHALIAEIDRVGDLGAVWRPISLTPAGTWNALLSLFVPLGVLLLAIQVPREERYHLLPLLIALGMISGLLGLMQVSGPVGGSLYFYEITNANSAVGLFSNRNHAAVFLVCLLPMLAIFSSAGLTNAKKVHRRTWASVAMGLFILPLILVTGSRAGFVLGAVGLVTVPLLYRPLRTRKASTRVRLAYLGAVVAAFGVLSLFVFSSQDEALSRLMATSGDEARFRVWAPIANMAWQYFPFGSGAGSFVEIFQLHEPYRNLGVNYLNHAHNDWLELYLTGGLPALLLMVLAVACWAIRSSQLWRSSDRGSREIAFGRMASLVLLLLALASIGDYPARTPSLLCLLTLMAVWLNGDGPPEARTQRSGMADYPN